MELFNVDMRTLGKLRGWYKRQPRQFRRASSLMLNEFAFGSRRSALDLIGKRMTIRNEKFISSRFRVTKSSPATQMSVMGTITAARFSGFVEQEFGRHTDRNRVATLAARSGSRSNQIKPRNRLKPSVHLVTMEDYGQNRPAVFVAMAIKLKERRLMRIGKSIVRRKGKRLQLIQRIAPRKKQPRKRPFMETARRSYFRSTNIKRLWSRTVQRVLTPPPG